MLATTDLSQPRSLSLPCRPRCFRVGHVTWPTGVNDTAGGLRSVFPFFRLREGSGTGIAPPPRGLWCGRWEATCWEPPEPSWDPEGKAKSTPEQLAPAPVTTEPASHETTLRLSPSDLAWRGRRQFPRGRGPVSTGIRKTAPRNVTTDQGCQGDSGEHNREQQEASFGAGECWKGSICATGRKALGTWMER